jgi:Spy/CpxP family protein refolding chaperone
MQGAGQPVRPPLLAGPKVTPEVAVGSESVFRVVPGRRPAQFGPYRWQRLLKQVDLDSRQRSEIERIVGEYGRAIKAFRKTHGKRVKTLARRERETRDGGGEQITADQRDELRELRAKRPKAAESLLRIWALLDYEQRQQMRDLLTAARKDAPRTSG